MSVLSSSVSRILSLQGKWAQPFACFLWEAAKIFHKQSSENRYDYWVSYASGACLASSSQYMSARFNPKTNFLTFNPNGSRAVEGPWKLLRVPLPIIPIINGSTMATSSNHDIALDRKGTGYSKEYVQDCQYAFFTQSGLPIIQGRLPHLYAHAWNDDHAGAELMRLVKEDTNMFSDGCGVLIYSLDRQENAIYDETLPHGSQWGVSFLQSVDENERRRYNILTKATSGRLLKS